MLVAVGLAHQVDEKLFKEADGKVVFSRGWNHWLTTNG